MKYRIWNTKENKYEPYLFLSQDGKRIMKEGWLKSIPLSNDLKVEQEYIFWKKDLFMKMTLFTIGTAKK